MKQIVPIVFLLLALSSTPAAAPATQPAGVDPGSYASIIVFEPTDAGTAWISYGWYAYWAWEDR